LAQAPEEIESLEEKVGEVELRQRKRQQPKTEFGNGPEK